MACPEDILSRMYPGGFSSVIDASTFFNMFLPVDEERRFMVLIHPDTGDHYWYTRLPMGSSPPPPWKYLEGLGRLSSALFFNGSHKELVQMGLKREYAKLLEWREHYLQIAHRAWRHVALFRCVLFCYYSPH
jgi:hypothetical protein